MTSDDNVASLVTRGTEILAIFQEHLKRDDGFWVFMALCNRDGVDGIEYFLAVPEFGKCRIATFNLGAPLFFWDANIVPMRRMVSHVEATFQAVTAHTNKLGLQLVYQDLSM